MGEEDIVIGEIVAPFGRKGEVKVVPLTDFPERFLELDRMRVDGLELDVEGVRFHKGTALVKFRGFDDISAAEELRGKKILISETELTPLEEDEYYVHDIIGVEVMTTEGESLGRIREVLRSPAHDVYVTDRAMIPAVKEFVVSIDVPGGRIVVRPVEGLVQE
ncbi:MAG TPA: ribosome maturation factor RimM [Armatimonadota bacterium]|nr:ribosome maturation factor RimM [Armatimonadota bacterium]